MSHRNVLGVSLVVAALATASGCSSSEEPAQVDLASRLAADTGVAWGLRSDAERHEVRFLAPARPVVLAGVSLEARARLFFARYAKELHAAPDAAELRLADTTTDEDGRTHLRFVHVLPGTEIPLFGVATTVHFTNEGALDYAQPDFREGLDRIETHGTVTEAAALQGATAHVVSACGAGAGTLRPFTVELGVSNSADFPDALAWRVRLKAGEGRCAAPEVWVDAGDGSVLALYDGGAALEDRNVPGSRFYILKEPKDVKTLDVTPVWHVIGPTTYRLETEGFPKVLTRRYESVLTASDIEATRLGEWDRGSFGEGGAVDGHYYATKALAYFKTVHGQKSLNGWGTGITVVVHDNSSINSHGDNAFDRTILLWDELHLGDGTFVSGGDQLPQGSAFDTMAHELAHGVTAHTSGLSVMREYGALNESFSDIMGATAENWLDETRDVANNLVFSERSSRTNTPGRDLANPGRFSMPDHYSDFKKCDGLPWPYSNDMCWVHFNSGIPSRAFSLMTVGGTHKKSKVTIAKGIGWEASRQLWFKTITGLSSHAHFIDAAHAQVREAAAMGPEVLRAVACSWYAVGVLTLDATIDPILAALTCEPPGPPLPSGVTSSRCSGASSGYVCNDGPSAHACNVALPDVFCADPAQRCRRASPEDPSATVTGDRGLECD